MPPSLGDWDDAHIPYRHRPSASRNITLGVGWILETDVSNGKYMKSGVHILKAQDQRMSTESVVGPGEKLNEIWEFIKDERVTTSQGKLSYTELFV